MPTIRLLNFLGKTNMKINQTFADFLNRFFIGRLSVAGYLLSFCLLMVVIAPLFANAINIIPCGNGPAPAKGTVEYANWECSFDKLVSFGQNITTFLLQVVAIPFATILFMWAGFLLIFKSSSAGGMEEAKGIFWNVVMGFVVALAAVLIVKFILFALQVKPELSNRLSFNVVELKK